MEMTSYLAVEGHDQGLIDGACEHSEHEGKINFHSFHHDVQVPIMIGSNNEDTKITHRPIQVTKEVDKASPKLHQALFRQEKLTSVTFEWYRFEQSKPSLYYKITLKNAMVARIESFSPNIHDDAQDSQKLSERVSFVYQEITWSSGESGEILFTQYWLDEA